MSRTRYEYKHINKNNAYVATKILSWTMKVLEEGNDVTNNDMYINLLLNYLTSKSIQDLLNEYIKFKIKILENKITGFDYVLRNTTVDRLKEDLEYEAGTVRVNGQDLEELLGLLGSNWKESLLKEIKESIITKVNNLIDENRSEALDDKMITTIKKLQDVFRLSDAEINCLILYYAMDVDSNFDILLNRSGNIQDKSDRIKLLFDITHTEARKIFFNNSPLWKYKILNENERVNTYIMDYLAGFQETPLSSIFYKEYKGGSLSLKSHSIRKKDNEILKEVIKRKEKNKGEHSISDGLEIITEFSNFMKSDEYKDNEMKNMNLLLHGPSGTGKTEFVKYLAKKTGRELLFRSGSDFLGMYVGQTEQNIKNAFREAEEKNAILFIDEVDGLSFDRSKSTRSFEVTQVNELLVQMENFNGILVCSSNFQKNMDSATYRRFNLKFEFDYLTKEGNLLFYKTILGKLISSKLSNDEKNCISSIKGLTPGDFKVVKQKYSFFNKKKIRHNFLIKALEEEVAYKDIGSVKKFGFRR